jgi:NADH-quinone oxidoreductase subunit H
MIAHAVAAILVVLGAAAIAAWIEPRLVPAGDEPGPAGPAPVIRRGLPDRWVYVAAPLSALIGVCWAAVVLPFGPGWIGSDLAVGLFFYLVVIDFVPLGLAMGGWGAATGASVEACYRAIAQLVAYVVPLGLAIIGPLMMARSLSAIAIVEAQRAGHLWYVVPQPLGFALYLAAALMQSYRAPFLEPFAASVDGGVLGVYRGWAALVWRVSMSALLFIVAAMGAVLFLGGYAGPILPPPVWMLAKTLGLLAILIVLGRRWRLRSTAETLAFGWKVLIPIGLVNVLIVGLLILWGVGQRPLP